MQAKQPISLSAAVVCYHSSTDELQSFFTSFLDAVERLGKSFTIANVPVFLIDNSDSASLSLEIFTADTQRAASLGVEIRLVHGHGNIGYGAAHNLVLSRVASDYHLLLNPDVVLKPDTLAAGIQYLTENPEVVLTSPDAVDEYGNKQHLCKRYPSILTFLIRGFFPGALKKLFRNRLARFEMHDLPKDEASTDVPIISGCFMLVRTSAFKAIHGFDERYFLYFEDFDLSLRLGQLGKLAYLPAMQIVHTGGHAARKGFRHVGMFARSGIHFFSTHGWRLFRQ
ncbi:MAG: glycosyltransferase family 2 protein [Proteobacteria bacterium]|nr:glycosyltransferase family 2 protein [Pseudomonadota bacterium]